MCNSEHRWGREVSNFVNDNHLNSVEISAGFCRCRFHAGLILTSRQSS